MLESLHVRPNESCPVGKADDRYPDVKPFPATDHLVPVGWQRALLDMVTDRASGHTPDQSKAEYWNGGIKWVSLADSHRLDKGYIEDTTKEISWLGLRYSSAVLLPAGTVVVSRDAGVGKSAVLRQSMAVSQHFIAWRCEERNILDPWFLYHWLQINKPFFERIAVGSTIKTIGLPIFRRLTIDYPPIVEQRKIAEILRTWDEAIEKLEGLRAIKETLASAIADDLIFGVRRVAGHKKPWALLRLAEVTRELTRRNRAEALGRDLVMGVTNSRGIVPMREQTIAADISRYLVLPPRAFAYNPMRINVGSIAMSRFEHDVLVSPDYVLFECLPEKLDPDFLDHLRQSHFWSHYINAGGTGSVRMRTYYNDLAALRLKLPPYDEQLAISEVLNTAKNEVRLIADKIDALTRQKGGLMQKLLTGEWRTKVDDDEGVAA